MRGEDGGCDLEESPYMAASITGTSEARQMCAD